MVKTNHDPADFDGLPPHELRIRLAEALNQNAALEQAHRAATHHQVTGLPNEIPFHPALAQAISDNLDSPVAAALLASNHPMMLDPRDLNRLEVIVVAIDLAYLRYWNTMTHDMGDRALFLFAEAMRRHLAPGATLFHIHGDEFVLVARTPIEAVRKIMRDGLADYRSQVVFSGQRLYPTADFGVATMVEALWAAGELTHARPTETIRDHEARVTLVKMLLVAIADIRSAWAKELERLALMAVLKCEDETAFAQRSRYLHSGDISLADVERVAMIPQGKERSIAIRRTIDDHYRDKLAVLDEHLAALDGLNGRDKAIRRFAMACALGWDPFTARPR